MLVDGKRAGIAALTDLVGVTLTDDAVVLAPLTATVIRLPYITTAVPDTALLLKKTKSRLYYQGTYRGKILPIVEEIRYDASLYRSILCPSRRQNW